LNKRKENPKGENGLKNIGGESKKNEKEREKVQSRKGGLNKSVSPFPFALYEGIPGRKKGFGGAKGKIIAHHLLLLAFLIDSPVFVFFF